MIYTVTLNPALDQTVDAAGGRLDPGGKGLNVSKTLLALGIPSVAVGLIGGETGDELARLAKEQGLTAVLLPASGATRVNRKVFADGTVTEYNEPGAPFDAAAFTALEDWLQRRLRAEDTLALCGSLPPGAPADCYARLAALCPGRVVVDSSGPALRAALAAHPAAVKPNLAELEHLCGRNLPDTKTRRNAAIELCKLGAGCVLLSLGSEGAMLVTAERVWTARAPQVPVLGTVGAGDAMTAMLCHLPLTDGAALLRACVAAGSAAVMQPGSLPLRREDWQALAVRVRCTEWKEEPDEI